MKKILIALLFAKSYEEKVGLSKEVKEILKKIKQRDLAIIEEGFNILKENEQYLEHLLASVSVNNSTGEFESVLILDTF